MTVLIATILLAITLTPPQSVWATREGLTGHKTASGHIIRPGDIFVALPNRSALGRTVAVTYGDRTILAKVLDVGPHNTHDPYWRTGTRPKAERGIRERGLGGPPKNRAGIDLSDALWDRLRIPRKIGIVRVTWKFSK